MLANTCASVRRVRMKGLNSKMLLVSGSSDGGGVMWIGEAELQLAFVIDQRGRTIFGRVLPVMRFGTKCVLTQLRDESVQMERISGEASAEHLAATTLESAMSS